MAHDSQPEHGCCSTLGPWTLAPPPLSLLTRPPRQPPPGPTDLQQRGRGAPERQLHGTGCTLQVSRVEIAQGQVVGCCCVRGVLCQHAAQLLGGACSGHQAGSGGRAHRQGQRQGQGQGQGRAPARDVQGG